MTHNNGEAGMPENTAADDVLELRIHGVNNMPPYELLDLDKADTELLMGDPLGSFWQPTADALHRGRQPQVEGIGRRAVVDPSESPRGSVPPGIHREAYSWGGMVRTMPPDGGKGGAVLAVLARACWTLVLPFSMANAGIWAWQLPTDHAGARFRSGLIRIFCVFLTLLLVMSFASVAMDMIAAQCFRGSRLVCTALPEVLSSTARWSGAQRVAAGSLVPIAVVIAVFVVTGGARLRYNVAGSILKPTAQDDGEPLLGQPRFWQTRSETHRLAITHLASAIAFVAMLCGAALIAAQLPGAGIPVIVVSALVLLVALVQAYLTDTMPFERVDASPRATVTVLGAAVAVYLVAAIVLGFGPHTVLDGYALRQAFNWVMVTTVLVSALLIAATLFFRVSVDRRFRVWHGFGPAVFLSMGFHVGLIWSSLVNVLIGNWLNGARSAASLAREAPVVDPRCLEAYCRTGNPDIRIGTFYPWLLGILLIALIVVLVYLAIGLSFRRDVDDRLEHEERANLTLPPTEPRSSLQGRLAGEVASKRAAAARFHLVEPVLGALMIGAGVAVILTLGAAYGSILPLGDMPPWVIAYRTFVVHFMALWIGLSLATWAVIGLAVIAGLVFGGSKVVRPLGLIWDLACFLPTAGHPLGAPCYTERAVPEVTRRMMWWLDAPAQHPGQRRIVLVAHSMGGVVAASALFALGNEKNGDDYRERVTLLTFGVQLRPYFGRFFPEVLGPGVIGTVPCRAPRLWARDPWRSDRDSVRSGRAVAVPSALPTSKWISLWRATDYLGFPAGSTIPNDRDRYAQEVDAGGYVGAVDTHSSYMRTPVYRSALGELAELPPRAPGAP
ncbi:hypothetical protein E6C70_07340 [Glaciibacter flavus]|uniref:Uncharacterized protein n=1 Tax=Orlajensenia flava TaxID=2565934 RepID=A0A4S4FUS7_9MICO|nr:hypothetical protein [Glaciibacter flavus]THG34629.1 hypothetical protein E6C70_07340 [Glaciibacter flavus]